MNYIPFQQIHSSKLRQKLNFFFHPNPHAEVWYKIYKCLYVCRAWNFPISKLQEPPHIQTEQIFYWNITDQTLTFFTSTVNPSPPVHRWPKDPESQPKSPSNVAKWRHIGLKFHRLYHWVVIFFRGHVFLLQVSEKDIFLEKNTSNLPMDILHT